MKKQIKITIECENAAFYDGDKWAGEQEIVRIIETACKKIEMHGILNDQPLFDNNGNRVGSVRANFIDQIPF